MRSSKFFTIKDEQRFIQEGLRPHREELGTFVFWHVFDSDESGSHPIYGEGGFGEGEGRRWKEPIRLPVLAALIQEAALSAEGEGLDAPDRLQVVINRRDQELYGLADLRRDPMHYRDRISYGGQVWSPYEIQQMGEVKEADTGTIVSAYSVSEAQYRADVDFNDPLE